MEVNAKPMGMQLKYSLCSTVLCRSYKTKYGQKASTCVHLSQSCWLVVQLSGSFPLGRAGKDPGKAFPKGDVCSRLALECPPDSCSAAETSEKEETAFVTAC